MASMAPANCADAQGWLSLGQTAQRTLLIHHDVLEAAPVGWHKAESSGYHILENNDVATAIEALAGDAGSGQRPW